MSLIKQAVLGIVGPSMTSPAHVTAIDAISARFRLIDIVSDSFKGAVFQAAAKIKFDAGNWAMRTYTPLELDPRSGRARILLYIHGDGAAARWGADVVAGAATQLGGPKPSLQVDDLTAPFVFFGDETSLAAARTIQQLIDHDGRGRYLFEVADAREAGAVADRIGLSNAQLVERQPGAAHLNHVAGLIRHALRDRAGAELVLTGNSRSTQALRAALTASGIDGVRQRVKAYWTPGKTGLD